MQSTGFKNGFILRISFISALGGYLFGFDFAVISGALPFLKQQFGFDPYWEGLATGILAIGAMIGCIIAGKIADKYGRRPGMMLAASLFATSSLAMALAPTRDFFMIARFIAGTGVGMASMLSPMYISEIAPAVIRGRLVAMNQLTVVLGILITNLINYALRNTGADAWRLMFGLGMLPSGLFLLGAYFLPESPRWLIRNNKERTAEIVLAKMGNSIYVRESLSVIKKSMTGLMRIKYSAVFKRAVLPAVLTGIGLAIFQQFCGINTVFNYAPKIFQSIGASQSDQLLQTVFIGAVNLVFTILSMALVDKLGRKPLMLIGAGGLCIFYLLIVNALHSGSGMVSVWLLAAIGTYAMTLAPVIWVLISEIFPAQIRSAAITIAVISLWLAYFVLVFTFPVLFEHLKENTFYIYAAICATGFLFAWRCIKETKGKNLEDVEQNMAIH